MCGCGGSLGVCGYVSVCMCGCGYVFTAHMWRSVGVSVWVWRIVGVSTCGMYMYLYLLCSV